MMNRSTTCFYPIVGYQVKVMERVADILLQKDSDIHILFVCSSVSAYRAVSSRFEKIFIPKAIMERAKQSPSSTDASCNERLIEFEWARLSVQYEWNWNFGRKLDRSALLQELAQYTDYWNDFFNHYNVIRVLVWNGYLLPQQSFIEICQKHQASVLYLENGFEPNSFVLDADGINAKSSFVFKPGQRVPVRNRTRIEGSKGRVALHRAYHYSSNQLQLFFKRLTYSRLLRYEFSQSAFSKIAKQMNALFVKSYSKLDSSPFIFFPLQVISDSQLLDNYNGSQEQAIRDLIEWIHVYNSTHSQPVGLLIKEHPRQEGSRYLRHLMKSLSSTSVKITVAGDVQAIIRQSAVVVTINSSVGYQALKQSKQVIVLGESIYAGDGLGHKAGSKGELHRSLDAIFTHSHDFVDSTKVKQFISQYQSYCLSLDVTDEDKDQLDRLLKLSFRS